MGNVTQAIIQAFIDRWQVSGAAERAAEEAAGHVRWLRPEYQVPDEVKATQAALI